MPTLSVNRRATTVGSAMTFRASSAHALPQSRLFAPCRAVSRSSGAPPHRSSLGHRSTRAKGSRRRYASKTTAACPSVRNCSLSDCDWDAATSEADRRSARARSVGLPPDCWYPMFHRQTFSVGENQRFAGLLLTPEVFQMEHYGTSEASPTFRLEDDGSRVERRTRDTPTAISVCPRMVDGFQAKTLPCVIGSCGLA